MALTKFLQFYIICFITSLFVISASAQKQDTLIQKKKDKKVKLAAIPIVNYNPSQGMAFGALGQAFYKVNRKDTISPSSSTGIFGIYTTNNTYFTSVFQNLYLNEDKWRATLAAGFGQMNFQFWAQLPGYGGNFIDYSTDATFAMARVERKVYKKLYIGAEGVTSVAKTAYDLPDYFPDSVRNDKISLNNIGILLNFDMREHQMNPYGGYNISFKNSIYREWLNSGDDFNKLEIVYNHYYQIKNERNMLATRFKSTIATGDVPFQGQSVVGKDDIRGYTSGKYRNDQVYALQAEYRWRFYKKFGLVGFAGIATAVEEFGDIIDNSLLPGAGVGFRYLMIPSERVNVGFDIAAGKDDWGLYFRIGESFGR